jgi:hypothetical protein
MIGFVQPGTNCQRTPLSFARSNNSRFLRTRGMFLHKIGARNTVPPRMLRIVPLGLFHIFFNLNSTKHAQRSAKSLCVCVCVCARGTFHTRLVGRDGGTFDGHIVLHRRVRAVDRHLIVGGVTVRQAEVVVLEFHVDKR